MDGHLRPELKEFLAMVVNRERRLTEGTHRTFYLVIPYDEYRGQRTHRLTSHVKVMASTFEQAVNKASEQIEESSLSAKLRGDISGWKIHYDRIQEAASGQRKKCHEYTDCCYSRN